jgi:ubiquinone/menaquinone biosynthesis C-methylase UbiE
MRWLAPLIRFAFHHFYNTFAFTYDAVSALVSRGEWREWARAALPFLRGPRVLDLACGPGNLLLDLARGGYAVIGADLSASMLRITREKFRRANLNPRLVRARAQDLPFRARSFDSLVLTFPPGFIFDPRALAEIRRVLAEDGRMVWVDAGRLYPRGAWSRFLNWALDFTNTGTGLDPAFDFLTRAGFEFRVEQIRREKSSVSVIVAHKANVP